MSGIQKNETRQNAPQPKEMTDFKILHLIGHGGFGKVFLAENLSSEQAFERLVAIKIVPKPTKKTAKTMEKIDQLKNEIRALRSFRFCFPFLASMHFCFENAAKVYIVMEYYSGGNLYNAYEDYFKDEQKRVPSEEEARFYVVEIVCALEYLHGNKMIYRDLKTENIMIEKSGHIKLTDFGLCKPNFHKGMKTRTICGTPGYQAPEMLQKKGYGHGVDIWALGVLLFEMLTNENLPVGKNGSARLPKVINHKSTNKEISTECHQFISALLTSNPANRPDILEVMKLPFVKRTNWNDVVKKFLQPPYVPRLANDEDVSRFGEVADGKEKPEDLPLPAVEYNDLFTGFDSVTEQENSNGEPVVKKRKLRK